MRQIRLILTVLFLTALYNSATVFAHSSGSFSASYNATQCAITDKTGALTGGIGGTSLPDVSVKVSSGSGVALVITPSFVTGLFTDNKLSSTSTTSTQNVGLRVKVAVDGVNPNMGSQLGGKGGLYYHSFFAVTASILNGPTTSTCTFFVSVLSTLFPRHF